MTFEISLSANAFTPVTPTTSTAERAVVDIQGNSDRATPILSLAGADTPRACTVPFKLPASYQGGTITAKISVAMAAATSGNVKLDLAWRRLNASFDRAFEAAQTATGARGSDPDEILPVSISFSSAQLDGAAAGTLVQLRLTRDNGVGSNAAGNAWVIALELTEE